jgi:para-nitrobenzyl esterase
MPVPASPPSAPRSIRACSALLLLAACGGNNAPSAPLDDAALDAAPDAADALDVLDVLDVAGDDAPNDGGGCDVGVASGPGAVATDRGVVIGARDGATWAYKAIPYAAPPVGALRWKPPQRAECWSTPRQATAFGPICPQSDAAATAPVTGAEDCLQLNVWVPDAGAGAAARPTLVFVHGGGFALGSAAEVQQGVRVYDGRALAEKTGAVVVTFNYRLGALGFLAHPLLTGEGGGSSGNYGTLDQVAALAWVQRNAAAFSADPKRVLVFGESAGAVSVCSLVASPLATGLFSAALMESGACTARALTAAETQGQTVFVAAKCDGAADPLACMRALPADAVVAAVPTKVDIAGKASGYGAVVDGTALTAMPRDVIAAGAHNHVPIVVGANSDETSRAAPVLADAAAYEAAVRALFPTASVADAVLAQYPASGYPTPRAAFVALTTDSKFVCGARTTLKAFAKGQSEPLYRYFYTHALEASTPVVKALGAWHGGELAFVFQNLAIAGYVATAPEHALADAIDGYWGRMAAAGDPSGAGAVAWPRWDASDPYLLLDDVITAGVGVRTAKCDFWDGLLGGI